MSLCVWEAVAFGNVTYLPLEYLWLTVAQFHSTHHSVRQRGRLLTIFKELMESTIAALRHSDDTSNSQLIHLTS